MEIYSVWWLLALLLLIAEMFSATYYLLAVALGFSAAGAVGYLGGAFSSQMWVAVLLCLASVAVVYSWKRRHQTLASNLNYDLGQEVEVVNWRDARHARVQYRGAEWDARILDSVACAPTKTIWRITALQGSLLIIE